MHIWGNPFIRKLGGVQTAQQLGVMSATHAGIAAKSIFLIALTIASALGTIALLFTPTLSAFILPWLIICIVGALICGIVASLSLRACAVFGSFYAVFEGALIGVISLAVGMEYGGVVFAALIATAVTFAVMAMLYRSGLIRVGNKLRAFVIGSLIAIIIVNILIFALSLFIPGLAESVYGNSFLGVIVNIFMILLGALMLLIDFDNISKIVNAGLPHTYEWRAAFGLTLTIIWLYIEFLKLFARFAGRRR